MPSTLGLWTGLTQGDCTWHCNIWCTQHAVCHMTVYRVASSGLLPAPSALHTCGTGPGPGWASYSRTKWHMQVFPHCPLCLTVG